MKQKKVDILCYFIFWISLLNFNIMLNWLHTQICFFLNWIFMFTLLVISSVFKSQLPRHFSFPRELSCTALCGLAQLYFVFKSLPRNIEAELRHVQKETEFSVSSTFILAWYRKFFNILFFFCEGPTFLLSRIKYLS